MKLKIFHSADIQVNCAGKHYNRFNEYEYMLGVMAQTVLKGGYTLVVLAGDMFERYNANDTEKGLLVNVFIRPILDAGIKVLWTDGNHDLKQKNFTFDPGDGSVNEEVNALRALTNYIKHPNLIYAEDTNFYPLGNFDIDGKSTEVIGAVWAHKSKYSAESKPLNPWSVLASKPDEVRLPFMERLKNALVFDVFHDPVKDSKNWDGKTVKGDNENRVHIDEFKGSFCLMGDIHLPDILRLPERPNFFATYPSSPIICYFGEGDYYDNFELVQESNHKHGYNVIEVNAGVPEITWKPLKNYTHRYTIKLDGNASIDMVESFTLNNPSEILNMVKFKLTSTESIDLLDAMIKHLTSKYNCQIFVETDYNNAIGNTNTLAEKFDVTNLSDREYLINLGKLCIEDKVNSTKDTEEYKEKLINDTLEYFIKALDRTEYTVPVSKYRFNYLKLTNFMPIAEMFINFDDFRKISNIVKINGNNGTGKTTIYKGLSWVAVGKIDKRQSDIKVKQNSLDYFNDKAWNVDTTTGELSVTMDSNDVNIIRSITRVWKAKATDENKKSTDWRNHIASVSETIQVKLNDVVLPDVDALDLLAEIFGGFDKFQNLHIINQASLDNMLLNLPLNDLISHILKSIGFTMTEQLNAGKKLSEEDVFKGLTKHNKDVAGINTDINIKDNEIKLVNDEISAIQEQLTSTTANINQQTELQEALTTKLHNISADDLNDYNNKNSILSKINELQLSADNTKKVIETPVWSAEKEAELNALKNDYKTKNEELVNLTKLVGEKQSLIGEKNLKISSNKTEMERIVNVFKGEISAKVLALKNKQTAELTEINRLKNVVVSKINEDVEKHNKTINEQANEVREKWRAEETKIGKIEIGINTLTTQNGEREKKKEELLSGSCNVCDLSYSTLPKVQAQVAHVDAEINENNEKITKLQNGLEASKLIKAGFEENIKTLESQMKQVVSNYDSVIKVSGFMPEMDECEELIKNNHSDVIEKQINELNETKIDGEPKESVLKLSSENTALKTEIQAIQTEIDTLNVSLMGMPNKITEINTGITTLENFRDSNSETSLYKKLLEIQDALGKENEKLNKVNDTGIKIEENGKNNLKIQEIKNIIKSYNDSQTKNNDDISKLRLKLNTVKMQKEQLENQIEEIKAYEHANNIWKVFTHVIGNKGLNKYVFDTVAMQINTELNGILDGLNYRIFFDLNDGYTLKMVDLLGQTSVRNLYTIGGMESTLGALALVAIIKSKTIKNNGDFIFIDEITGKLNNSEDTKGSTATNKDYQLEFFQILGKLSENTNICIIDHVLPIDWFQGRIDIIKYDNGKSELVKVA